VGRRRGRASHHVCALVHGGCREDETDRVGPRCKGTGARTKASSADKAGPHRRKRERGARAKATGIDRPAPPGRGREGARACELG
jgi:hypothetical protein